MGAQSEPSWWARFWHTPVRAERLGLMRWMLGLSLLVGELMLYLPNLADLYGPTSVTAGHLRDDYLLRNWRWTMLWFNGDNMTLVHVVFALWLAATAAFTVGFFTRTATAVTWLLTLTFFNRTVFLLDGGDALVMNGLLLLLLAPSGQALSLDAWWRRRRGRPLPRTVPPWSVRVLQIQLCLLYFSAGVLKMAAYPEKPFTGTWWEGTTVHYTINFVDRSRWAFAQWPQPLWWTALLTYVSLFWEAAFPLLVLHRWTRRPALCFGVLFHLGIFALIEIGCFSLYALSFYGPWVPDSFWQRRDRAVPTAPTTKEL
jgi:hypothetical protein